VSLYIFFLGLSVPVVFSLMGFFARCHGDSVFADLAPFAPHQVPSMVPAGIPSWGGNPACRSLSYRLLRSKAPFLYRGTSPLLFPYRAPNS
jgi:hypothetical protein